MKILFLSTWFPYPPNNGSRIRAYNLMRVLARKHRVFLVSLLQEDSRPEDAAHLSDLCEVVSLHESRWFKPRGLRSFLGFFSASPRSITDTFDPAIRSAVERAMRSVSPDLIVASQLGSMVYVPEGLRVPVVFEEVEIGALYRQIEDSRGLRRLRRRLMFRKHTGFVKRLLNCACAYTCVSAGERDLLNRFCDPQIPGVVVPNGVDSDFYAAGNRDPERGTLIYNGALTYGANLDAVRYFASEIYPVLALSNPGARLRVTGRTDGVDLRGIEDCPGIELTGYVDDIRSVLSKTAACVVPLRQGGGSRLKILEAMAAGVPVVSTSVGAEGLDCVNGEHLLIADGPTEFAEAVHQVMTDADLAERLSERARNLVEQHYDWSIASKSLLDVVESVAGQEPG